jgi:hypothetical protein
MPPDFVRPFPLPIEPVAVLFEDADRFVVFHGSSKGLFVNSFGCGLWGGEIIGRLPAVTCGDVPAVTCGDGASKGDPSLFTGDARHSPSR